MAAMIWRDVTKFESANPLIANIARRFASTLTCSITTVLSVWRANCLIFRRALCLEFWFTNSDTSHWPTSSTTASQMLMQKAAIWQV